MVGDYGNARIIVRDTTLPFQTGVLDSNNLTITDAEISTLNGTEGIQLVRVLAWSTRIFFAEVVSIDNMNLPEVNTR